VQSVKRFVEWYLGIPPAGAGQGTAWRIESRPIGPDGWVEGLAVTLGVALAAGVIALYFREAHRLTPARRLTLAGLRLAALGLVAVMLSQVTLSVDRTGLPVVAVLVDDSASMGLSEGLTKKGGSGAATRLDLARQTLTRNDGRFLRSLARRFRVRLYHFDSDAAAVSAEGTEDDLPSVIKDLRELMPDGTETRPAAAVRRVLDDLRGVSPSAVVVFTDGVATGGEAETLSAVAPLAARRRAPLFPVGIGSDGPGRDLELYDLTADEVAFLGDPVRVTARFRTFGLRGTPVTLTLTNRETGGVLAEATAEVGADGRPGEAELVFTPEAEGDLEVSLAVRTGGSEANTANNAATRRVSVRNQKVRVLLAEHAPRYEFRFLKALLEREPTVDLDTVLQEADLGFSQEDRTALERFPLRKEEILAYDVIIFGDLDPGLLGADALAAVAEFVRVKGGGLIGIAGPEFFPSRYAGTPLEPLLPVALEGFSAPSSDVFLGEPFRPRVTLQGRQAGPMFRLADAGSLAEAAWDELPGLYWRADAPTLRPGAVVLVEAPNIAAPPSPLVALQRFGAGKVLLHLTDETWRWRFRAGDAYFGRYWVQTIRYLSRAALLGRDRAAELTADRRSYTQGEPVTLRVRFLDDRLIPQSGGVTVVIEDRAGGRQELVLERTAELSDSFEARLERMPQGSYHAWVREPAFTGVPPAFDFRIDPPDRELLRREADFADLRRAAELSGGRFSTLAEADRLPSRLPAGRPVRLEAATPRPLWNRPELLLALAGVLTAEWLLRKRARLA
jgi:hypothetical protein